MACLSYKPNLVTLEDGNRVERSQAVEMQNKIASELSSVTKTQSERRENMIDKFEQIN